MSQPYQSNLEMSEHRLKLRHYESEAKLIPYISFILTHVALVLFLVIAFFIDRFIANANTSIIIKIVLATIAVALLASEWIYAIRTSLRWKKMITTLSKLEEEQLLTEMQERQRQHDNALAVEQLRNRALLLDRQRQRDRREYAQPGQDPRTLLYPQSSRPVPEASHEGLQQNDRSGNT